MYGLMDCNNFYASCECVFNPALRNRAIVVLSNNDGCVIARSAAAKQMGIKMGTPAFLIKNLIESGRIVAMSSNYTLYGDMSGRVMTILRSIAPKIEIYSIDEAFFDIPNNIDCRAHGQDIAATVTRATGIPVSIGIAPTKTLAKVANHAAKKYPGYRRVCVIDSDEKRLRALQLTPIDEVWGIGRQYASKLRAMGINTAFDFVNIPRDCVRRMMTVGGERTWCELRGQPCIELDTVSGDKHQICTSRSFGTMITSIDDLVGPISTFASRCAQKLRAGNLAAGTVMPFLYTNVFRPDLPQIQLYKMAALPRPGNDTRMIVDAALRTLREIYLPNYQYKKAGVIVGQITPAGRRPLNLFTQNEDLRSQHLMTALDSINNKYGKNTVRLTSDLAGSGWQPAHGMLSPNYTTDINDIIEINCGK